MLTYECENCGHEPEGQNFDYNLKRTKELDYLEVICPACGEHELITIFDGKKEG